MVDRIVRHQDLDVYRKAFAAAMKIFAISKTFPKDETYSLTDQIRHSSRSVCANLAEGWRKRLMSRLLSQSYAIVKEKPQKPKTGLNLPFAAII